MVRTMYREDSDIDFYSPVIMVPELLHRPPHNNINVVDNLLV